jgi:4-hydroxy-4-methyl-2-oxoglutarate aldolase
VSTASSPSELVRGHVPVLPPRWVQNVPRLDDDVVEAFGKFSVPDISDAVGPLYTMAAGMRPLYEPINRLMGRALTVKAPPGDSLTIHGAISVCRPGDVLVIDWRGHVDSCSGGAGMLMAPIRQGLAGVLVDGAWRDVLDLQALGFPIFGRGISAVSRAKSQFGEINVPVSCGGVVVNAGDLIVADAEGIVVVPRLEAASICQHVAERSAQADALRNEADRAAEVAMDSTAGGLAENLERRATAHYGDQLNKVPRSEIFANVFAAAGGVSVDWDEK